MSIAKDQISQNQHLTKSITSLKVNKDETIFNPYEQTELLKDFQSSIFRAPARPQPLSRVVMPVPKFSTPVACGEFSNLDNLKGAGCDDIHPQMVCGFFG